jgi:hypothetical protein
VIAFFLHIPQTFDIIREKNGDLRRSPQVFESSSSVAILFLISEKIRIFSKKTSSKIELEKQDLFLFSASFGDFEKNSGLWLLVNTKGHQR